MDMGGRSPGAVAVGTPGAGAVPALAEALADEPRLRGESERAPWLAGVLARNNRLLGEARGESAEDGNPGGSLAFPRPAGRDAETTRHDHHRRGR